MGEGTHTCSGIENVLPMKLGPLGLLAGLILDMCQSLPGSQNVWRQLIPQHAGSRMRTSTAR